jgi:hypothetical protein
LPNDFKNDSDSLGESGGSDPQEDLDLELKKQELELCQTGPKYSLFYFMSLFGYLAKIDMYSSLVSVSCSVQDIQ